MMYATVFKSQPGFYRKWIVSTTRVDGVCVFEGAYCDSESGAQIEEDNYFVGAVMTNGNTYDCAKYSTREKADKVADMFLEYLSSDRIFDENFEFPKEEDVKEE